MVIFLLFCYARITSGKGNVIFTSRNFYNVLTWDAAPERVPGQAVRYSVFYGVTDDVWFAEKAECQNITELHCDLTSNTPPHHDTYYRAKVTADGVHHGTSRNFKPIAETVLGAPILSYHTTRKSLHMTVTLPVGPNDQPIADIFRRNHKGTSKAEVVYRLFIEEPIQVKNETTSDHFEIGLRDDTVKYCGYVVYTPVHELGRPVSEEAHFCTMLPEATVLPWVLLCVAAVMAFMLMAVCFAKRYVKNVKKDELPLSLDSVVSPSVIMHSPTDPHISHMEMYTQSEETGYAKIRVNPNILSAVSGGYGHKNTIFTQFSNSSSSSDELHHPGPDSAQSSEVYGEITVGEHLSSMNQAPPMSFATDLPQSGHLSTIETSSGEDSFGSDSQPFFLQTRRKSDGQLLLNLPPFEKSQTFTGPTEALVSPDRKPLLSYLIVPPDKGGNFVSLHSLESYECSDSGLDDNTLPTPTQDNEPSPYLAAQPDVSQFSPSCESSDSGYKQNWMPSLQNYKTSYPWTWLGVKDDSV